jgi:hypothetical protein
LTGFDFGSTKIICAKREGVNFTYKMIESSFSENISSDLIIKSGKKSWGIGSGDKKILINGQLNRNEPDVYEILKTIVREMTEPKGSICFSHSEDCGAEHIEVLTSLFTELGYKGISSANEGRAIIYAELSSENFTGLGISFGGCLINICCCYYGNIIFNFSTNIENINQAIEKLKSLWNGGIIAIGGGKIIESGFKDYIKELIKVSNLPVTKIHFAKDPLFCVARGVLKINELGWS